MSKKLPRPEFESLVPRIASGELTRQQAAELASKMTGMAPGSFLVWLSQNHSETLKAAGVSSRRSHAKTNPDKAKAYDDALAEAATSKHPVSEIAAKHGVNYVYLLRLLGKSKPEPKTPSAERLVSRIRELRTELAAAEAELEALLQP